MGEETEILKEILKWTKISSMKEVKSILNSALNTDDKKIIYQNSDGSRGLLNFKDISSLGKDAIARYWKQWYQLGLVEMKNVRGGNRAIKNFSLEDFGIEIPNIDIKIKEESEGKVQKSDTYITEEKNIEEI